MDNDASMIQLMTWIRNNHGQIGLTIVNGKCRECIFGRLIRVSHGPEVVCSVLNGHMNVCLRIMRSSVFQMNGTKDKEEIMQLVEAASSFIEIHL